MQSIFDFYNWKVEGVDTRFPIYKCKECRRLNQKETNGNGDNSIIELINCECIFMDGTKISHFAFYLIFVCWA